MENLKIENSAEAQRLLFKLGHRWRGGENTAILLGFKYLYIENGVITCDNEVRTFNDHDARHITLDELREYKPMLTHMEVIERLRSGLGVEVEVSPSNWAKLSKENSLKVFCSDYKFRGCE